MSLCEEASPTALQVRKVLSDERERLSMIEEAVENKNDQLGTLHNEYCHNLSKIHHFFENQELYLKGITNAAEQKKAFIHCQMEWVKRLITEKEDRPVVTPAKRAGFLRTAAKEMAKPIEDRLAQCYKEIIDSDPEELRYLAEYDRPSEILLDTGKMLLCLRGEEESSWQAVQVILSSNYFSIFLPNRLRALLQSTEMLSDDAMDELEKFFEDPDHSVANLYHVSPPIGTLGAWMLAVRDLYRLKQVTSPFLFTDMAVPVSTALVVANEGGNEADASESAMEEKRLCKEYHRLMELGERNEREVQEDRNELFALKKKLNEISTSVGAAEKEQESLGEEMLKQIQELRSKYDFTMVPILDELEMKTQEYIEHVDYSAEPCTTVT